MISGPLAHAQLLLPFRPEIEEAPAESGGVGQPCQARPGQFHCSIVRDPLLITYLPRLASICLRSGEITAEGYRQCCVALTRTPLIIDGYRVGHSTPGGSITGRRSLDFPRGSWDQAGGERAGLKDSVSVTHPTLPRPNSGSPEFFTSAAS